MQSAERTRAANLADICKTRFPLHEAASRYLLASEALSNSFISNNDWDRIEAAQLDARDDLRREFARVGLDKNMLQLLGVVL